MVLEDVRNYNVAYQVQINLIILPFRCLAFCYNNMTLIGTKDIEVNHVKLDDPTHYLNVLCCILL